MHASRLISGRPFEERRGERTARHGGQKTCGELKEPLDRIDRLVFSRVRYTVSLRPHGLKELRAELAQP